MTSAGVTQIIESTTERIDAICKAISTLNSRRRPSFGDIEERTEVLKSYYRQTVTDIAGLVGVLTKNAWSSKNNYDAAVCNLSGECQTAILVLQNSNTDKAEKQKELLLKVLNRFLESLPKSVDSLQANSALSMELARLMNASATKLKIYAAAVASPCFVGLLYSYFNHSAIALGGVILYGVVMGHAYGITKAPHLSATLTHTAKEFDQASREVQRVEDLICEHINIVRESLAKLEGLSSDVWASATTTSSLQPCINKLLHTCHEFERETNKKL